MPRGTEHLKLGTTYFRVGMGLHGNFLGTLSRVYAGIAEAYTCASRAHRLSEMALQELFASCLAAVQHRTRDQVSCEQPWCMKLGLNAMHGMLASMQTCTRSQCVRHYVQSDRYAMQAGGTLLVGNHGDEHGVVIML